MPETVDVNVRCEVHDEDALRKRALSRLLKAGLPTERAEDLIKGASLSRVAAMLVDPGERFDADGMKVVRTDYGTDATEDLDSKPAQDAAKALDKMVSARPDDSDLAKAASAVKKNVKTTDGKRRVLSERGQALHETAGAVLQGLRTDAGTCVFCGSTHAKHGDGCVAWPLIRWRDGDHAGADKLGRKLMLGEKNRAANSAPGASPAG